MKLKVTLKNSKIKSKHSSIKIKIKINKHLLNLQPSFAKSKKFIMMPPALKTMLINLLTKILSQSNNLNLKLSLP
jgi:hypothetical protein